MLPLTKKRIVNRLRRYFPVGKIQDSALNKIKCIRHTITWRCNYMCTSCDIWKIEKPRYSGKPSRVKDETTPEDIDRMCKSPLLKDVTEVIISGGEPLLRNDFPELIMAYHRNLKKATFGITINGYDPERAYNFFNNTWGVKWHVISISLNGRREVHNKSRGLDCFDNIIETAKVLREFSRNVSFSFTFLKDNVDHFDYVNELGKSLGISTHVCYTVSNDRFVASKKDLVFDDNPELISVLERYSGIDKIRHNGNVRKDFIRYKPFVKSAYMYDSILNRHVMPCHAARTFFHIAPYGDIYPCNFDLRQERILGNIKDDPIDTILNRVSQSLLEEIKRGDCMYPNRSLCGDSDISRSIGQVDTPAYEWFRRKRENGERLIQIENGR